MLLKLVVLLPGEHCAGIGSWGRMRGPDRTADSAADCAPDRDPDNIATHTVTYLATGRAVRRGARRQRPSGRGHCPRAGHD